jgi:hypothetical protein
MDQVVPGDARAENEGSEDERLLDLWLDARLSGDAADLGAFFARHGDASPSARARVEAIAAAAAPARGDDARADVPSDADAPPERIGDFRIVRLLGEGGMGAVHLAVQESLGREVALKVLRPELRGSADAHERFRREALAVGRLRHPNIVGVFAVGEERGVRWLAMELVPGRTLSDVLADAAARGETVGSARALRWAHDLARALHVAHEQGVIHRDVKPSNVRITPDDRPMLLDFGIARDATVDGPTLTQTFAGSPLYAAPEQFSGAALDARADVYALGATLYQCLTGRVPFAGGTMEEVLRRVLSEEPLAPRRLVPTISVDAETVMLKALAKEPDARYASAAAFADDLQAALEGRAIRARPPGPVRRLARWSRRRPAIAAGLGAATFAVLAFAVAATANERATAADARRRAAETLDQARARLVDYRARCAQTAVDERRLADLKYADTYRWLAPAEESSLRASEASVEAFHREREIAFQETLETLRFAERLDAGSTAAADAVRAELYRERWLEARAAKDVAAQVFYRRRVEAFDRERRYADEMRCVCRLDVESDPPGARAHLLRVREQAEVVPGGDRRLVPVPPEGAAWPVAPGAVVLRVVAGGDVLRPGDLVTTLDGRPVAEVEDAVRRAAGGGARAQAWSGGTLREVVLPKGVDVRATAAPAFTSEQTVVGTTPLKGLELEEGDWLLVFEATGRERVVHPLCLRAENGGAKRLLVRLPAEGDTPPGFVHVDGEAPACEAFAIMEREVTAAEYLEFLNDPATLARIDASSEPILFPRTPETRLEHGRWPRRADGTYELPDWTPPDWPALGVSWRDAQDYAAWRTARAVADGRRDELYALPTIEEWVAAAGFSAGRTYPFGERFSARWVKSCHAKPTASPEPVMSYPIDESPFGAFDMAGSAYEWNERWFDADRGLRLAAGGSWGQTDARLFRTWGGVGMPETRSNDETGFRLVLRRRAAR